MSPVLTTTETVNTVNINEKLDALLRDIDVVHCFAEKSRSYKRLKELEASS
jgi:hypothetical protein